MASVTLIGNASPIVAEYRSALMTALPFFFAASMLGLASFWPRKLSSFYSTKDGAKNLLYFQDVASLPIGTLETRFTERYRPPDGEKFSQAYLHDLVVQVAVTSKIANRKFAISTAAACSIGIALLILALPAVRWVAALLYPRGS